MAFWLFRMASVDFRNEFYDDGDCVDLHLPIGWKLCRKTRAMFYWDQSATHHKLANKQIHWILCGKTIQQSGHQHKYTGFTSVIWFVGHGASYMPKKSIWRHAFNQKKRAVERHRLDHLNKGEDEEFQGLPNSKSTAIGRRIRCDPGNNQKELNSHKFNKWFEWTWNDNCLVKYKNKKTFWEHFHWNLLVCFNDKQLSPRKHTSYHISLIIQAKSIFLSDA